MYHMDLMLQCFNMHMEAGRTILNINGYVFLLRPAIDLFLFIESDIVIFKGSTFSNFLSQFTFLPFRIHSLDCHICMKIFQQSHGTLTAS